MEYDEIIKQAFAYREHGKITEALRLLDEVIAKSTVSRVVAWAYAERALCNTYLALHSRGKRGRIRQRYLTAMEGDINKGVELTKSYDVSSAERIAFSLRYGDLCMLKREYSEAVTAYRQACDNVYVEGVRQLEYHGYLAEALASTGRSDDLEEAVAIIAAAFDDMSWLKTKAKLADSLVTSTELHRRSLKVILQNKRSWTCAYCFCKGYLQALWLRFWYSKPLYLKDYHLTLLDL